MSVSRDNSSSAPRASFPRTLAPERRILQQIEGLVEDPPADEAPSDGQSSAPLRHDPPAPSVCKWCKGGECTGACRD